MKYLLSLIILGIVIYFVINSNSSIEVSTEENKSITSTNIKTTQKNIEFKNIKNNNIETKQTNNENIKIKKAQNEQPKITENTPQVNQNNNTYDNDNNEKLEEIVYEQIQKPIKPIYKKWKTIGDVKYNVFQVKQENSFAPPSMPQFVTLHINNKKVNVAISPDKENYLAIAKGKKVEIKKIHLETPIPVPNLKE